MEGREEGDGEKGWRGWMGKEGDGGKGMEGDGGRGRRKGMDGDEWGWREGDGRG